MRTALCNSVLVASSSRSSSKNARNVSGRHAAAPTDLRLRLLDEADQQQAFAIARRRNDDDAERRGACFAVRPAAGHDDSRILVQCALNGRSQLRTHALARHCDHIIDRAARYDLEITIHGSLEVETFEFAVDQHRSRTIGLQHHPPTKLGKLDLARRRGRRAGTRAQPGAVAGARGETEIVRSSAADATVKALRFGNDGEPTVGHPDRLGVADQQKAAFAQREMDDGDDLGLRLRQKVDQKVPARNEIETREWRVGEHVLHREHDVRAQLGRDPVVAILLGEKSGQSFWRHVGLDRVRIEAFASARHRLRIDVAGEDLQFDLALRGVDLLAQKHGEGIGLLAGTATGDPDSQRPIQRVIAHEVGNNALGQKIENGGIAKEARDIDQQIPGELIAFVGVAKQEIEIPGGGLDRRHRHPALDAPLERAVLVKRKVVNRLRAQEIDDLRQQILYRLLRGRFRPFRHKDAPRSRSTSASAIFAARSTRSTAPVAMALRGMPS